MEAAQSDALVFFGASGDLAYKQIFPALLGLVADEGVNVPIVGVAKAGWTVEQLRARATDSIARSTAASTPPAFAKLLALLPLCRWRLQRSADLRASEAGAWRRKTAAALSRDSAEPVRRRRLRARQERSQRRRAPRGREAVRPRSRIGAGAQPDAARAFPRGGDLSHRSLSRQGAGSEHPLHAVRQRDVRAALEPPVRAQHPDHDGRSLRRAGPRRASTTPSAPFATWFRTTCCRFSRIVMMDAADRRGARGRSATRRRRF